MPYFFIAQNREEYLIIIKSVTVTKLTMQSVVYFRV